MGCSSEINMFFSKEKHARWAMHVAEEMIKLFYAPDELPWIREAAGCPSLSRRYLACREELASYRIDPHNTSLEWLKRNRTNRTIQDTALPEPASVCGFLRKTRAGSFVKELISRFVR